MNGDFKFLFLFKHQVRTLVFLSILSAGFSAQAATVVLNLFNTEPLTDAGLTPLLGNAASGDLIQLYTLGGDNLIDIPQPTSGALNDDVLFGFSNNPTFVGAGTGIADNDSGILVQVNIQFDDSLVGSEVYVRYWNAGSINNATGFNQTAALTIPSLVFGEATLDFAPSGTGPYITSYGFSFGAVPEPSSGLLILSAGLVLFCRSNFRKWAVYPQHIRSSCGNVVKG